ncbi:carbohydrate ABC transporter permease [Candidatus Bipolaricaulota bacterium]|jgi:multiple sugar transport system permease protein|nr:carbohydrate ABC transporter permease [Candidatus Bipolaricaulota bacterium]TFH10117.1 MAG: carbohydrate ABC transporter permease [Candidatus Atribacteria bacterium]
MPSVSDNARVFRKSVGLTLRYVVLIIGAAIVAFPFLWMIFTSFKEPADIFSRTFRLFPREWNFSNYASVFEFIPFASMYLNSVIVAMVITISQLFTSALAGYAFARLKFPGREVLFYAFLATMMLPEQVRIIPSFLLLKQMHLIDTHWALILPWMAGPFAVFFMRQSFMDIPQSLFDAARIDGAGNGRILFRIVIPLTRNIFLTLGIFTFMWSWNMYLWPLVMTHSMSMRTLPVGLSMFQNQMGTNWAALMAASVMAITPIVVAFFLAQRKFMEGITLTGIKS